MNALAQRAAEIAKQARAYENSRGTTKPANDDVEAGHPAPQPERHRWTVYRWGDDAIEVTIYPAQTWRSMRERYPDSCGIIERDDE